ncbi:MAG: transcription elongation factor GreA [Clostridia bacterium]|nr:transcription elongation factor GreA [Clostridia bacterium]
MAKQTILTPEGLKKLENELEYLKVTGRKEIAEKIKTARGFGDLSENSEYDAAKDAQAKMEERISTLEAMLKDVVVLDADDVATDIVGICSKVKVLDMEFDDEDVYTIVGATEANPDENIISDESPIGQALIGRKEGEIVDIETPGGMIKFKILEISK